MRGGHSVMAGKGWLLVCLAVGLALPATAQLRQGIDSGDSEARLQGTLGVEGGRGYAPNAAVRLEDSQGRVVAEQSVGASGQFSFADLPRYGYTLVATADGYESYVQHLDLTGGAGMEIVNIVLRPARNAAIVTPIDFARTDATVPNKARKEFEKGERAGKEGKLAQAQAHFAEAVSLSPCYARAQVELGLTRMRERDLAHAEAPLRKAAQCDPDFVEPYLHLGRLLNAEHRYVESRSVLAEGVRRAPSSWLMYYYLGQADEGLKKYALAEQEFLRALSFGAGVDASVHANLADVYLRENAYDKAYTEMNTYLRTAPGGPFAAQVRAIKQQLESAGRVHPMQSQLAPESPKS